MTNAAKICPSNFFFGEMTMMSSFTPNPNTISVAATIYFSSWIKKPLLNIRIDSAKPIKMAMPPKEGTIVVCDERWLGSSYNFFSLARCITEGIIL